MIVPAVTYLALRCPSCGRLQVKVVSLFACGRNGEVKATCKCRTHLFTYGMEGRNALWVRLHCILCEGHHFVQLSPARFRTTEALPILCEATGAEVGFTGPRERVKEATRRQGINVRELVDVLGDSSYFHNPQIMCDILQYFNQLARSGNLYCHCGNNDIEVEVFPDHLELHCPECQVSGSVRAKTLEDLAAVRRMAEVELAAQGLRCRRASRTRGRPRETGKK